MKPVAQHYTPWPTRFELMLAVINLAFLSKLYELPDDPFDPAAWLSTKPEGKQA